MEPELCVPITGPKLNAGVSVRERAPDSQSIRLESLCYSSGGILHATPFIVAACRSKDGDIIWRHVAADVAGLLNSASKTVTLQISCCRMVGVEVDIGFGEHLSISSSAY